MLNRKQKLFAETYLANGYNALQAYYTAYPGKDTTDPTKKPSYPYVLLKNPEVKQYIEERRQEIYESLNIDANHIAQELADIGFAPKGDEVYNTTAKLKALEILTKILGLQQQKIETTSNIEVSLED